MAAHHGHRGGGGLERGICLVEFLTQHLRRSARGEVGEGDGVVGDRADVDQAAGVDCMVQLQLGMVIGSIGIVNCGEVQVAVPLKREIRLTVAVKSITWLGNFWTDIGALLVS